MKTDTILAAVIGGGFVTIIFVAAALSVLQ